MHTRAYSEKEIAISNINELSLTRVIHSEENIATPMNCKVAWDIVYRPTKVSQLGIHNLGLLNEALRVRYS